MLLILPALTNRPSFVTGCHSFSSLLLPPRRGPRRPPRPRPRSPPRSPREPNPPPRGAPPAAPPLSAMVDGCNGYRRVLGWRRLLLLYLEYTGYRLMLLVGGSSFLVYDKRAISWRQGLPIGCSQLNLNPRLISFSKSLKRLMFTRNLPIFIRRLSTMSTTPVEDSMRSKVRFLPSPTPPLLGIDRAIPDHSSIEPHNPRNPQRLRLPFAPQSHAR